jgi:hypothetical protein
MSLPSSSTTADIRSVTASIKIKLFIFIFIYTYYSTLKSRNNLNGNSIDTL